MSDMASRCHQWPSRRRFIGEGCANAAGLLIQNFVDLHRCNSLRSLLYSDTYDDIFQFEIILYILL